MERREHVRRPSRIQVHFWERGAEKRSRGYTVNISDSGMYLTTNRLLPKGTRIRAELTAGNGTSAMLEAVVTRAERSVHQLRPDAMGVRFLTMKEIVGELVPEITTAQPEDRMPSPDGVFTLRFADREQFLAAYHRDLSTGGLFVPSDHPAALNETVTVELGVAQNPPIRFQARVVHRFEPGGGNLIAGMGVELLNFDKTLEALKALAAAM